MVDIDVSQFRKLYLTTALEYAQKIEDQLKMLAVQQSADTVNEIFIAAHSLKSQSLIMGYTSLADASLSLEKTYRRYKDTATEVSKAVLEGSMTLLAAIRFSLKKIESSESEANIADATGTFKQIAGIN